MTGEIYQFKNELVWHSTFHTFSPPIHHLWLQQGPPLATAGPQADLGYLRL